MKEGLLIGLSERSKDPCEELDHQLRFASFEAPGVYEKEVEKEFDLSFLQSPRKVLIRRVKGKRKPGTPVFPAASFEELQGALEFEMIFPHPKGEVSLTVGPIEHSLLVSQKKSLDFSFGLDVPDAERTVEREVKHPGSGRFQLYAFLSLKNNGQNRVLNHHSMGLERIRLSFNENDPSQASLEIVSFERVITLARYNFRLPKEAVLASEIFLSERNTQ